MIEPIIIDVVDIYDLLNDKSEEVTDKMQSTNPTIDGLSAQEIRLALLTYYATIKKFVDGSPNDPNNNKDNILDYIKTDRGFHMTGLGKFRIKRSIMNAYERNLKNSK